LYWKFLLAFTLSQLTAMVGLGITYWLEHRYRLEVEAGVHVPPSMPDRPLVDRPPGPPPDEGRPPPDGPPRDWRGGPPHHPPHHRPPLFPLQPLIAGVLVSLLFSMLVARYFARPIEQLSAAFDAAARGDLSARPSAQLEGRNDELADLAHDFERMAGRLQQLLDSQRSLLHDVSHELRSPLARLQLAIDLAEQQPERTADSLQRVLREAGRIEALVAELLALSRLEADVDQTSGESVDLTQLLAELVDDARFEAASSGQEVDLISTGALMLNGRPVLLQRALENIVRNALHYSPAGSRVSVAAERQADQIRVTVCDQGPGVPAGELEAIFTPFYRGEERRKQNIPPGNVCDVSAPQGTRKLGTARRFLESGYGLGLAIAQRVVSAHGGRISAYNRQEGGLCVEIVLPVHTEQEPS
jgi:signal transduction histidine kinase